MVTWRMAWSSFRAVRIGKDFGLFARPFDGDFKSAAAGAAEGYLCGFIVRWKTASPGLNPTNGKLWSGLCPSSESGTKTPDAENRAFGACSMARNS